jgi:hypothetical protein
MFHSAWPFAAHDPPKPRRPEDKIMRPFHNLEYARVQSGPVAGRFSSKNAELAQLLPSGAALRRAVAKFLGLLRRGKNRK